jgi:hypothetical protein
MAEQANESPWSHPLTPVVYALMAVVFTVIQLIVAAVWMFAAMCGTIARLCGLDAEEAFADAEEFGVPAFWTCMETVASMAISLSDKFCQFIRAHQIVGFVLFILVGICILFPIVRLVIDGRLGDALRAH